MIYSVAQFPPAAPPVAVQSPSLGNAERLLFNPQLHGSYQALGNAAAPRSSEARESQRTYVAIRGTGKSRCAPFIDGYIDGIKTYFTGKLQKGQMSSQAKQSLVIQEVINAVRDFVWGSFTAAEIDVWGNAWSIDYASSVGQILFGNAFLQQTGAQWLYSTVAMIVVSLILYGVCKKHDIPVSGKEIFTHFCGANFSLPAWNVADVLGTAFGAWCLPAVLGTSVPTSIFLGGLLFGSFLTGLFETTVQTSAQLISRRQDPNNPPTWKEFREGIKFGGFGGAAWNVVCQLFTNNLWSITNTSLGVPGGALLTGAAIAPVVCFFNDRSSKQIARDMDEHAKRLRALEEGR